MFRKILFFGAAISISGFLGCGDPVSPEPSNNETPQSISGTTTLFASGGDIKDTAKWDDRYMINTNDYYYPMRFTNEAAHSGKYSNTTDSNRTALTFTIDSDNRLVSGICGVQFYIMAKEAGGINFTLELGQYAGSSGGLSKGFGIGFDVLDSIKATSYDFDGGRTNTMYEPIQLGHWYKCQFEIDFTTKKVVYFIDDHKITEGTLPTKDMYGIDRLLILRGIWGREGDVPIENKEGSKKYFIDDIVFYKK